MKIFSHIIVILIFISCDQNKSVDVNRTQRELHPLPQTSIAKEILTSPPFPKYVNILEGGICYRCSPVYVEIADIFKRKEINQKQIIYIMPNVRSVVQTSFLREKLLLEPDSVTSFFDDAVLREMKKEFMLPEGSCFIKLLNRNSKPMVLLYNTENFEKIKYLIESQE